MEVGTPLLLGPPPLFLPPDDLLFKFAHAPKQRLNNFLRRPPILEHLRAKRECSGLVYFVPPSPTDLSSNEISIKARVRRIRRLIDVII